MWIPGIIFRFNGQIYKICACHGDDANDTTDRVGHADNYTSEGNIIGELFAIDDHIKAVHIWRIKIDNCSIEDNKESYYDPENRSSNLALPHPHDQDQYLQRDRI